MALKELKKTTEHFEASLLEGGEDAESHYHIVYLNNNPAKRYGTTSPDKDDGHTHEVVWQPANPQDPAGPGAWVLGPAEDGHTHDIEEYITQPPRRKQKAEEAVGEVHALFKEALELERECRAEGFECEGFLQGDQWDHTTKQSLEARHRAALVINRLEKSADELEGIQRQQRTDLRYLPTEEGDQATADMYNVLTKHILEQNYFPREESLTFRDQFTTGRGNFELWVDFTKNLLGDIRVGRFPWDDIVYGPHIQEDASDCEYQIKHRVYSEAKMKHLWPRKAKEISRNFEHIEMYLGSEAKHTQYPTAQYAYSDNRIPLTSVGDMSVVDVAKKEMRVLECWRRVYVNSYVAANAGDEFFLNLHGWKKVDRDAVGRMAGFFLIQQNVPKIRITKVAGGVLLSDEEPADLPSDDFHTIPVYGKKSRNRYWGKISRAKDAQREVNHRHSQMIDIGNKMSAYGWFYDATTFPNDSEAQRFKENATSPGGVYKVNDIGRLPQPMQGVRFPTELSQLLAISEQTIRDLMDVNVSSAGANESAAHLSQRQKMQLSGNEYLFDNMGFAKKQLGRLLVPLIKRYYSPERVWRILANRNKREPVQLGGQSLETFSIQSIAQMLNEGDVEKYDVIVSEVTHSPTARLTNQMLMMELNRAGVPVPPQAILEVADLPEETKRRIEQQIAQQQQAQASAADTTAQMELGKTLLSKTGQIAPVVAQKLGLPPQQVNQVQQPQGGVGVGQVPFPNGVNGGG